LRERQPVARRRFVSPIAGHRPAAPEPLCDGHGSRRRQRDGQCYEQAAEIAEVERVELSDSGRVGS